ncbi:VWA domain-containing protein [uncultured Eubacterium sp.]|uniref:InlB B-repeat-containing protein n=1 Tax=uncultured Eubacterium sp. TaxID=165185 RepID=UPI0032632F92
MKVKTLRKIAYVLIFAMMVEAITLNININAFSKETITLEKMNENKVKDLLWLKEKQKKDGSFGENLKTYYTTQLLENLEYENTFADEKIAALKYLEDIEVNSNDDLFRKYNAASKQNKYYHINMEEPKWNELQNTDGGFSLVEGYKSDILDTVLAVNGMLECDSFYGAEMNKSMEYIKRAQNNDGSFVFVDGNPNIYLTAYTYKTVNRYLEGNINSSVKNVAQQAESYLLKNEKEDKLWGVGEEKIKDTLMASIALAKNDENTLNRIALISDEIGEDGSIYSDVELTSLYVSLINEYEIACGKLDLNYVKIKDVKLCADKERIGAYTEIEVIPVIFGMKDNYEIIVTISDDDDYTTKLNKTKNNIYVWNTQNKKGTFEISIMVVDKSDMRVVASKTKQIKVYETFDVTSLTCSVSPKAYKLNCGKSIKVNTSAYVLSNINKSVTREIIVKDEEGNRLYTDAEKVNIDCKDREIMFDEFSFEPEIEKTSLLSVETNIKADDKVIKTKTAYIKVYESEDENRIDIDYDTNANYIYNYTDEVNVNLKLAGKGLSENIKRRPMDIVIILDNSGSMSSEDWIKASEGAKIIVENMQPEDRMEIRYINRDRAVQNFTNDKELLNKVLDNKIVPGGATKLNQSFNWSIDDLKKSEDRDKSIYIFSDGVSSGWPWDLGNIREDELINDNIRVFSVFMSSNVESEDAQKNALKKLDHLAEITGGLSFDAATRDNIETCITELLGDMFKMAGKDINLTMTVGENIPIDNVQFGVEPVGRNVNEDGSTTIKFDRNYLSVGEDLMINIKFLLSNLSLEGQVELLKDIKFSYIDENDENVEVSLDDIVFDVVSDVSTMVPEVADDEEDYDENEDGTTNIINNNELNIFSHNKSEDIQEVTMDLLSGNIEMSDKETFIGDELQANVGFDNASNLDDKNVKVKVLFVNKNNQQNTYVKEQNIDVEQTKETTINIDTENLFEGDYIVILIAELNNEMTALDATGISLKEHMYKLTVNADKGGSVDITNGEYKCGELIHIVATAKDGYVFDRWVSDDIELLSNEVNSSNISISMPKKDASIKAIFAKTKKLEDKSDNYDSQDGDNCKDNNVNGNDKTDSSKININRNAVANKGVDKKANSGNKVSSVPKKERQNNVYRKHNNKNNSIGNNHKKTGTLISPLTGDFAIKDKIRIALIIQSIALIVICIALKKKDETEQKGV